MKTLLFYAPAIEDAGEWGGGHIVFRLCIHVYVIAYISPYSVCLYVCDPVGLRLRFLQEVDFRVPVIVAT